MEVEGTVKVRKRQEGPLEVSFEPKDSAAAPRRSRSFSSYDGMRRYLLDMGMKQDKIPAAQELRPGKTVTISEVKVDSSRIAA